MEWQQDFAGDGASETALLCQEVSDEEKLLTETLPTPNQPSDGYKRRGSCLLANLNFIWTIGLIATTIVYFFPHTETSSSNALIRKVSTPSPLFDSIHLGPRRHQVSGSLHDDGSIFRQPPSVKVDEAWYNIALHDSQLINVTAADIVASGKDPTNRVRWSEDEDSYPAQVEFSHKVHCLNEIRKEIWGEHYFGEYSIHADDADSEKDEDDNLRAERRRHRQHAMHCLHIILQDLTCNVDVGIITHKWIHVPGQPDHDLVPMADFSTEKQCRDYDAASDWVRNHAVENGLDKFALLRNADKDMASDTNDNYW